MRDLYRRIGLGSHTDDRAAIERAIAATQSADAASARAAKHILLDPERKAIYDRTRVVALRIGQLRANLGLARAPNGLATDSGDFETSPSTTVSQLDEIRRRRKGTEPNERYSTFERLSQCAGIGIGALVLFSCLISGVLKTCSSQRSTVSNSEVHLYGSSSYTPPPPSEPVRRSPRPPLETRADKIRKLVTKRFERARLVPSPTTIEAMVEKLIRGQSEPIPATAVVSHNFYGQGVAPLAINTRIGHYYYVKVVDWTTKEEKLTAFIRGGEYFKVLLPVGSYEIRYAAGQKWYGPILDFGEGASYSRCDERFDFERTFEGYSGYTIDLILQANGNLETDPISEDEF